MSRRWKGIVRGVRPRRALVDVDGAMLEVHMRGRAQGRPRESVHLVVVGDRVRVRTGKQDGASLEEVLPRRNVISRADPGDPREERRHDLAANLDALCIVASLDRPGSTPAPSTASSCWARSPASPRGSSATRSTCAGAGAAADPEPLLEPYRRAGYPALETSAPQARGLEALRAALAGRLTLLIGPSGAGKSSLLNALYGLALRTGDMSRATSKGTHTTTRVDWIDLPGGGAVLDSPGSAASIPRG